MREIYRILDANANRVREAARVIEDFARFALDDAGLAARAKGLRSRLQMALSHLPAGALLAARDTPGDVGTSLTTPTEQARTGAEDVATAACKRLTEALRTLEEYAKVVAAETAPALERLRYDAYDLEARLTRRARANEAFADVRLYVLLTSSMCRRDAIETARAAIDGGAGCIQLREKDMPDRDLLVLAERLRQVVSNAGALLIVNDRPDIAAAVSADGVHLGQDDLPVSAARRVLPPRALVGVSTHNIDQARAAAEAGADYIGVGPMFATATKDAGPIARPALLRQFVSELSVPHVAIGGITAENVSELVQAGARRVAVCSAVIATDDPAAAAAAIRRQLPE